VQHKALGCTPWLTRGLRETYPRGGKSLERLLRLRGGRHGSQNRGYEPAFPVGLSHSSAMGHPDLQKSEDGQTKARRAVQRSNGLEVRGTSLTDNR
jgi:hypothetical protein